MILFDAELKLWLIAETWNKKNKVAAIEPMVFFMNEPVIFAKVLISSVLKLKIFQI